MSYYKKGLYDSTIGEFTDSLEKIPGNAIVHYHLGLAYHIKRDNHHARTALEKELRLNQNFDGADEASKYYHSYKIASRCYTTRFR